jgi:hypothetical protein
VGGAAQRWFDVDGERPAWIAGVADVLASVSDVLPALVAERVAGYERMDAINAPAAAPIRAGLAALGFDLDGPPLPMSLVGGWSESEPPPTGPWYVWRPSARLGPVAEGIEPPCPVRRLDAYHPVHGIGVDIEWNEEPSRRPAAHELGLIDTDVRHLALARRRFGRSVDVFERLLADERTRCNILARLPLRGVLIVEDRLTATHRSVYAYG